MLVSAMKNHETKNDDVAISKLAGPPGDLLCSAVETHFVSRDIAANGKVLVSAPCPTSKEPIVMTLASTLSELSEALGH